MKSKREKKIKGALVDDHHVVRKALCKMLVDLPTIEVAFDAADGKQFLEELTHHHIDVVLLDLEMPVMNGWQTIKALQTVTLKCLNCTYDARRSCRCCRNAQCGS